MESNTPQNLQPKNFAPLLYNAVRETLETMAFAEVIPCSIKIGDTEYNHENGLDDFILSPQDGSPETAATGQLADSWGTATPDAPADDWGTAPPDAPADDWGTVTPDAPADDWGTPPTEMPDAVDDWGESTTISPPAADPWGDAVNSQGTVTGMSMQPKEINFDELMENQDDWCWSCMRVNSPDIHSIWFIVSKELAFELARNMYAGEDLRLDNPIIRDLVAELTNVLGGRLMLLLENMGGKFTLTVPEIGIGFPKIPDNLTLETVLCRVLVDGEYPVIVSLSLNQKS